MVCSVVRPAEVDLRDTQPLPSRDLSEPLEKILRIDPREADVLRSRAAVDTREADPIDVIERAVNRPAEAIVSRLPPVRLLGSRPQRRDPSTASFRAVASSTAPSR
jgi:hypothetical protein